MSYILFFVISIVVIWGILEYFGVGNDRESIVWVENITLLESS